MVRGRAHAPGRAPWRPARTGPSRVPRRGPSPRRAVPRRSPRPRWRGHIECGPDRVGGRRAPEARDLELEVDEGPARVGCEQPREQEATGQRSPEQRGGEDAYQAWHVRERAEEGCDGPRTKGGRSG